MSTKPAKRSRISPTQRSLKKLRDEGYLCQVVEHFNVWAKIRQDLFGCIDVLAIKDGEILGVQATTRENVSHRVEKISNHENISTIRKAGIRVVVHGWGKLASSKQMECRIVDCS